MTNSELLSKYFGLSDEEIETLMKHFFADKRYEDTKKYKENRLTQVLKAVCPYCENFINTDEKIRHKVGVNMLTKFNFDNFDESLSETKDRLSKLFKETTARNINPYKIIYSGVLTDGNLRSDFEKNKSYDKNRDFINIYNELCETLNISENQKDEETRPSKIFEKCSTLISKVYANNIHKIYNFICDLKVWGYKVFREKDEKEVTEILKNNPSLFGITTDAMHAAYNYLRVKIEPMLKGKLPHFYDDPEKNKIAYEIWILRNWLKNNSSLLTISADSMFKKEKFLRLALEGHTQGGYQEALDKMFKEPVMIGILDKISISLLRTNAVDNVVALENFVKKFEFMPEKRYADVSNYIMENPYFLGMNKEKFKSLLNRIEDVVRENPDLFVIFLKSGRTLFASNIDFSVNQITNKLLRGNSMITIDVDKLSGKELVAKFNEIFNDNNENFQRAIEGYITEREKRNSLNEKEVRKTIRNVGERIKEIPKLIKVKKGLVWNLSCINSIAEKIDEINKRRFLLAGTENIYKVEENELKNANVENMFNKIRDIYEQKRFKVSKKYVDSDKLFEKTIEYLSQLFDDKEAIEYIFRDEISKPFVEILKEHFNAQNSSQTMLMGKKVEVPKIENKKIEKSLKNISNVIAKGDSQFNVSFDK